MKMKMNLVKKKKMTRTWDNIDKKVDKTTTTMMKMILIVLFLIILKVIMSNAFSMPIKTNNHQHNKIIMLTTTPINKLKWANNNPILLCL